MTSSPVNLENLFGEASPSAFLCRRNQHGFAYVFVAVCLVAILGVVGYAVDSAHLRRSQNILQKAVDNAAKEGARNFNYQSWDDIRDVVVPTMLNEQLTLQGIDPTRVSFEATTNDPAKPEWIELTASLNVDTMLLDAIKLAAAINTVQATTTVEKTRLLITLVLDTSSSLCWPSGECFCAVDPTVDCPKIAGLTDAAKNLIDAVPENDTWLGMVRFSGSGTSLAQEFYPITQMTALNKDAAKLAVDNINWNNLAVTNMLHGIGLGETQLTSLAANPNDVRVMVVFSDGMPNTSYTQSIRDCIDPGNLNVDLTETYLTSVIDKLDDVRESMGAYVYMVGLGYSHDFDPDGNQFTDDEDDLGLDPDTNQIVSWPCMLPPLISDPPDAEADVLMNPFQDYPQPYPTQRVCVPGDMLRDYFFSRAANDRNFILSNPIAATHPDADDPPYPPLPYQPDFPCVDTQGEQSGQPGGKYYHTAAPGLLPDIFVDIVAGIVRMTQ